MTYKDWLHRIEQTRHWLDEALVTREEFRCRISELVGREAPVSYLEFAVELDGDRLVSISAGELTEGLETAVQPSSSEPAWQFGVRFRRRSPASKYDRDVGGGLSELLFSLLRAYWKPSVRDQGTGLPSLKQQGVQELMDRFISRTLDDERVVGCAFLDADGFKEINQNQGYDVGDLAIAEIGARCRNAVSNSDCVVCHEGGDEFVVLGAVDHEQTFVDVMLKLYRSVRRVSLEGYPDVSLSLACGISFQVADERVHRYEDLRRSAEAALMGAESGTRDKQRGTMSIGGDRESSPGDEDETVLWTRCSLGVPRVLGNAWLNLVSGEVEAALTAGDDPSVAVHQLVEEMQLELTAVSERRFPPTASVSGTKKHTQLDLALAVLHGIAAHRLQSQHRASAVTVDLVAESGVATVRCGDLGIALPGRFNEGKLSRRPLATIPGNPDGISREQLIFAMRTALLVHVGEAPQSLLDLPFYASIFVDDRPTKGGQLPDFWQHVASELFSSLTCNPNIRRVYCWGDETFAARTLGFLREIGEGSVDKLKVAKALGRPESEVSELCERLKGAVFMFSEINKIVGHYLGASSNIERLWALAPLPVEAAPTLVRNLATNRYRLAINEGLRSQSIGEAVPLALEILRQPSQVSVVDDKYGRKFHELIDFNIVIEPPTIGGAVEAGHVGASELNEYYDRAFGGGNDSLFYPEIKPQLPRFLEELRAGVEGPAPFTSRRAIIVIPNRLDDDGQHPLGLVAIRASIVSTDGLSNLRFAYYWRTVEALVGLPHNLYASSKHALTLAELLAEATDVDLSVGRLTYIASSLHVSSEPSVLEIAKRIVDAASR